MGSGRQRLSTNQSLFVILGLASLCCTALIIRDQCRARGSPSSSNRQRRSRRSKVLSNRTRILLDHVVQRARRRFDALLSLNRSIHNSHDSRSTFCTIDLGYGRLVDWFHSRQTLCSRRDGSVRSISSNLVCGSLPLRKDFPPNSFPHNYCHAQNVLLDATKVIPSSFVQNRAYWKRSSEETYCKYKLGAFIGDCRRRGSWNEPVIFSPDHFRDIFSSFQTGDLESMHVHEIVEYPVFFVTREADEYRNLFHAVTDILAFFEVLIMLNHIRLPRHVIFLDTHGNSTLDFLWHHVISLSPFGGSIRSIADLGLKRIVFRQIIFVPPGYTSILFVDEWGDSNMCLRPIDLVVDFSSWLRFHLRNLLLSESNKYSNKKKMTLVIRRPSRNKPMMDRMIENDRELQDALIKTFTEFDVNMVDFADFRLDEQIRISSRTDVLIGFHGAGLSHLLFMPKGSKVLEIIHTKKTWHCYKHLAVWRGMVHEFFEVGPPTRDDHRGKATRIPVDAFIQSVASLLRKN